MSFKEFFRIFRKGKAMLNSNFSDFKMIINVLDASAQFRARHLPFILMVILEDEISMKVAIRR